MFIKVYSNYYNLDQVYKLRISDPQLDAEKGINFRSITLHFAGTIWDENKQETVYISSLDDEELFWEIQDYLLKNVRYSNKWN